jgi:hypothetical protein
MIATPSDDLVLVNDPYEGALSNEWLDWVLTPTAEDVPQGQGTAQTVLGNSTSTTPSEAHTHVEVAAETMRCFEELTATGEGVVVGTPLPFFNPNLFELTLHPSTPNRKAQRTLFGCSSHIGISTMSEICSNFTLRV